MSTRNIKVERTLGRPNVRVTIDGVQFVLTFTEFTRFMEDGFRVLKSFVQEYPELAK